MEIALRDVLLIASWGTLLLVWWQLRANAVTERHKLFIALTDCVTDDAVDTMGLHPADHFRPDTYESRYKGNERRIRSYLLMKRKYLYLYFAQRLERRWMVDRGLARTWIAELCHYQEFHDVHLRQHVYYPKFAKLVNLIAEAQKQPIDGEHVPDKGWMCEEMQWEERKPKNEHVG